MPGIYGGDDISAIVVDAGSCSTRAGWAGEDTPRVVIPSYYGWLPGDEGIDEESTAEKANGQHEADDAMEGVEINGATNGGETVDKSSGTTGEDGTQHTGIKKKAVTDWELQKRKAESRRRFVGDGGVNIWRKEMDIGNPFEDGVCEFLMPSYQIEILIQD